MGSHLPVDSYYKMLNEVELKLGGVPLLFNFSTDHPFEVVPDLSVQKLIDFMKERDLHHVPVRYKGKTIGIVSSNDLKFTEWMGVPGHLKVSDVMTPDPVTFTVDTSLGDAIKVMDESHIGSALIVDQSDNLIGIFTLRDALRALSEFIVENEKGS